MADKISPMPNPQSEERAENTEKTNITAGKAPKQGTSVSAAVYETLAAGRHNSLKSNIDTSKIQTNSRLEKAAEARAEQAAIVGSYTPSHIIKNTGLEAKASFYEVMGGQKLNNKQPFSQKVEKTLSAVGNKAQAALARNDDMGNQTAGGMVQAGAVGYTGFKMAQTASPLAISAGKGVISGGKGVWDVTTTVGKATVTLARTTDIIASGFVPFNTASVKGVLLHQAKMSGLPYTATSQRIIQSVKKVQTTVINIKTGIVQTGRTIKTGIVTATNAVKRNYYLVRGVVNGTVMASVVAHNVLQTAGVLGLKGIKLTAQGAARGGVKGGVWTVKRGIPKAMKGIDGASKGAAGALTSSDNMMVQGTGYAIQLTNYGVKTGIATVRTTGSVVKTTVKGATKTYKAIDYVIRNGWRAAWAKAKSKAATTLANAGKSVVTAVVNLIKSLGSKVVVPLILIVVIVSCVLNVFAAPVAAIGGIFSGLFDKDNEDGTYTETDIRDFITDPTNGVPAKRNQYINDLYNDLQSELEANGGSYDYVRLKTNTQDSIVEPTVAGITNVFYTDEDLANVTQPIFNAIILKDYELAPTDKQAKKVLTEIFDKLFRIDENATVEYCGQSALDGSGTPSLHSCGSVHAAVGCPNSVPGTHTVYTCPSCCFYRCDGHQGTCTHSCADDCAGGCRHVCGLGCIFGCTHVCTSACDKYCGHTHSAWNSAANPGCYTTTFCRGCIADCYGYTDCMGHDVLTVTLNMDGLYQLLYEYFEQPIDTLSSKANRTEDEEDELTNLKDSYEICLELVKQVSIEYGGGLTMEDLSDIVWVYGSRAGNQAIIDVALSQVGQVGGQPYWSWYGFSSRVEWCACFASWCMNQVGHGEVRYSSCNYGGVPYFQGIGWWANGGFTDLAAGDVIFFDWQGDGIVDHTGLVIGTDGAYVYTVEGNSGDTCKVKKYAINTSVIAGYGTMYW